MTLWLKYFMGFALLLGACSGPPPPDSSEKNSQEQIALEKFFLRFRQNLQQNNTDSTLHNISSESIHWLEDMRYASRSEPIAFLKDRPFFEILSVLALRVERREHPDFNDNPKGILQKLLVQNPTVKNSFLKNNLGHFKIYGQKAELGFSGSENVPVYIFWKEEMGWKIHLVPTLTLILQGAESFARHQKPTPLEQAIFILEKFAGKTVLAEDLR